MIDDVGFEMSALSEVLLRASYRQIMDYLLTTGSDHCPLNKHIDGIYVLSASYIMLLYRSVFLLVLYAASCAAAFLSVTPIGGHNDVTAPFRRSMLEDALQTHAAE